MAIERDEPFLLLSSNFFPLLYVSRRIVGEYDMCARGVFPKRYESCIFINFEIAINSKKKGQ